ncbi:hypothetical protein N0V93_004636 [Gnomoniopsis smithogilvyi]|uniref:Rhodopsin domain-containing protein n=1 Tax=Gnomoniopsis smithogilvyi TaxID=1191159 RepID=A0A9W9CWC9_9PEZI|nr:hypothetical protein N0V93_004636 [Gnomoniopsis smithogilvyi]
MSMLWQQPVAILAERVDRADETNAPFNLRVTTTLLLLATLFVGLRFLARHIKNIPYGPEDWTCFLALIALCGCSALNYTMVANGLGRHADTLPTSQLVTCLKCLLALECMYNVTMVAVKISFCFLYLRLFPMLKYRIWAIAGFVLTLGCTFIIVGLLQCTPMEKIWMPTVEGTCLNTTAIFLANAGLHIVSDIALLLLPVTQVIKLRVELVVKLSLVSIFMLGAFVSIASIYRIKTILAVSNTDITFTFSNSNIWTMIEMSCAVISTCLPCLRPLVAKISGAFATMSSRSISRSRKARSVIFPNGFRRKSRTQTTHTERSASKTPLPTYNRHEQASPFEHLINECDDINCQKCATYETTYPMDDLPGRKQSC